MVTHILDLVTCVVFDVWNGHSNELQPGSGRRSADPGSEGNLMALSELSSGNNGRGMQPDLKKLVSDICAAEGILSSWILNQAQSKKLLDGSDDAESMLIEAAEAAAVLVRFRSQHVVVLGVLANPRGTVISFCYSHALRRERRTYVRNMCSCQAIAILVGELQAIPSEQRSLMLTCYAVVVCHGQASATTPLTRCAGAVAGAACILLSTARTGNLFGIR
jgi:hypothetical protein